MEGWVGGKLGRGLRVEKEPGKRLTTRTDTMYCKVKAEVLTVDLLDTS